MKLARHSLEAFQLGQNAVKTTEAGRVDFVFFGCLLVNWTFSQGRPHGIFKQVANSFGILLRAGLVIPHHVVGFDKSFDITGGNLKDTKKCCPRIIGSTSVEAKAMKLPYYGRRRHFI